MAIIFLVCVVVGVFIGCFILFVLYRKGYKTVGDIKTPKFDYDNYYNWRKKEAIDTLVNHWYSVEGDPLLQNKEFILDIVKSNGWIIRYLNDRWKNDRDVVLASAKTGRCPILPYIHSKFSVDKEIALAIVTRRGWDLEHLNQNMKEDKDIAMAGVKNDGMAVKYLDQCMREDKEIMLAAIENDGLALQFVGHGLMSDKLLFFASLKSILRDRQNKNQFKNMLHEMNAEFLYDKDIYLLYHGMFNVTKNRLWKFNNTRFSFE